MNDLAARRNGETYFFRDQGQFDLLRLKLLPELIERRRGEKSLRLCSAGCASGEEAYSLAMLLDGLLPDRSGWNIFILGVDIDPSALEKARLGRYRQWSFRQIPAESWRRYFQHGEEVWTLDERIRRMVTFQALDLIGDAFPDEVARDMDLILCRNVFIYFTGEEVAGVAAKLAATLSEGGYLVTGHTELIGHRVPGLRSRLLPEGVVYRRETPVPIQVPPVPRAGPATPAARRVQAGPPSAIQTPREVAPLTRAREAADRGDYALAEQACHAALDSDPLAAAPHFLLAQLAQLRGDFARSGALLEKTLYLDPGCVAAHLELAALCERDENLPRARGLRHAALEIVRALPGDALVEPYETNAAEMAQWLAR